MNWGYLVARLISSIASWLDAANLRNRVYRLQEKNEIMYTALTDIQRMDAEGRMGWHAKRTLDQIDGRE
jgi:hypothetical protein